MRITKGVPTRLPMALKLPQSMDNNFGQKLINLNYCHPFTKLHLGDPKS